MLGVIGNADLDGAVLEAPHPLMGARVLEIGRDVAHLRFLRRESVKN